MIKSLMNGSLCLDVEGDSKENGARMIASNCHGGNNQQFSLDDKNRIVVKSSNKCVEISGGNNNENASVGQWDCHEGTFHQWTFEANGEIKSMMNGKCLDVKGGKGNGTPIIVHKCKGGSNQKWSIA
jgi:hypothetical protein